MKRPYFFVANWKMNITYNETISFATTYYDELIDLNKKTNQKLILCPSFESLYTINQMFKSTQINIGAQNCSSHIHGAFTGQVSPLSLSELGCKFCIIGHSEHKRDLFEKNETIIQKLIHLLDHNINPIFCIGETEEEYKNGKTFESLTKQITKLFATLHENTTISSRLTPCIAYEPIWAIGTGNNASKEHIDASITWIADYASKQSPSIAWNLLYGGSINSENIVQLKEIKKINGFLLGKASLDFQEFKKIVQLGSVK